MTKPDTLRCLLVTKEPDGSVRAGLAREPLDRLPPGDVLVRVRYSSLNYKDALAVRGHAGVVRQFPHVPGIDAAGQVVESSSNRWQVGQEVVITGFEFGSGRWGGYAQLARVPADWLVPLPAGLTLREAMILGTAGFTAAQSVAALEDHAIVPSSGPIVVTGASGGVGSISVAILARLGYEVVAVSGKPQSADLLTRLGAKQVIARCEVDDTGKRPLLAARWAGAVDTVGGNTLATILRATKTLGVVTACGLVAGVDLPLTVHPFILRGVSLVGIDSTSCPAARRADLWNRLAGPWKPADLELLAHEIPLEGLEEQVVEILAGRVTGRVVVRLPD